ncbi:MAG TPA: hypothetical protein PKL84_16140 [Candidatus Hydrogenedentes bacterium]|nr:hypothetical protein [Candidatus Hydrogenedentota bacterium]
MKYMIVAGVMCQLLVLCAGDLFTGSRTDDPLGVAVSPHTLLLSQDQPGEVIVHTSIPLKDVDCPTVQLNGLPAKSVRADLQGHIVAEFSETAVKAIVAPPEAVLTLTGLYKTAESFSGSDTVRVVP